METSEVAALARQNGEASVTLQKILPGEEVEGP